MEVECDGCGREVKCGRDDPLCDGPHYCLGCVVQPSAFKAEVKRDG